VILSLLAVLLVTGTVLALLVGLTVVPFVGAVDAAARRGFAPARWGVTAAVGSGVALLLAAGAVKGPHLLLLPAVLVAWAVPLSLRLAGSQLVRLGGRAGEHQ